MKNRKGFTLVELLAVIVILAAVMLIGVTAILPLINRAQRSGLASEGLSLIATGKAAYEAEQIVNYNSELKLYPTSSHCFSIDWLREHNYYDKKDLEYSGSILVVADKNSQYNYYFWITNGTHHISGGTADNYTIEEGPGGDNMFNCGGAELGDSSCKKSEAYTIPSSECRDLIYEFNNWSEPYYYSCSGNTLRFSNGSGENTVSVYTVGDIRYYTFDYSTNTYDGYNYGIQPNLTNGKHSFTVNSPQIQSDSSTPNGYKLTPMGNNLNKTYQVEQILYSLGYRSLDGNILFSNDTSSTRIIRFNYNNTKDNIWAYGTTLDDKRLDNSGSEDIIIPTGKSYLNIYGDGAPINSVSGEFTFSFQSCGETSNDDNGNGYYPYPYDSGGLIVGEK